jgi:hypothetical protein
MTGLDTTTEDGSPEVHSHPCYRLTSHHRHCLLWLIENAGERDLATLPPSVRSWIWDVRGNPDETAKGLHKTRYRWIYLPPHTF